MKKNNKSVETQLAEALKSKLRRNKLIMVNADINKEIDRLLDGKEPKKSGKER